MQKVGNKITKVLDTDVNFFGVQLQFSDNFVSWVSLNHLFEKPKGLTAEILRGSMFEKCFVESGALAWPNGFELCPDALRQWAISQQMVPKKKAA